MRIPADVAGAARSGADIVQRLLHRRNDHGMLTDAEIVVGAPDSDRLRPVMAVEAARIGEAAFGAQYVDEDAIPAFVMEAIDRRLEDAVVIQAWVLLAAHYRRERWKAIENDSQLKQLNLAQPVVCERRGMRSAVRGSEDGDSMRISR